MENITDASGEPISMDCLMLIECLKEIEIRCINFLQKDEGQFLITNVKMMYSQPQDALKELRKQFGRIVDPVLLKYFQGTWMAFLLWNDFSKRFQVLYNYSSSTKSLDIDRYKFVSGFINSPQFDNKFSEPMTDILFSDRTARKRAMVFSWQQQPVELSESDLLKPVMINFGGLSEERWAQGFRDIEDFVDEKKCDVENMDKNFDELATHISHLAQEILKDAEFGMKIFEKAAEIIKRELAPNTDTTTILVEAEALCRSLIWNRLFDKNWKYLYYIPAKFLEGSAVSGVVCAFEDPLKIQEYVILMQIVNRVFSLIQFGFYLQNMGLFALRSATAAIMARNKSHIHGSHIEHGLRNKMNVFEEIVGERLLERHPFYDVLREQLVLS